MKTLGLDLGSRTGWAICEGGIILASGFVDLVAGSDSSRRSVTIKKMSKAGGYSLRDYDPRPLSLAEFLNLMPMTHDLYANISRVAFEDVRFVQSLAQGQLWASLRGAVWIAMRGAQFKAVEVGTLKKWATGKGDAQKEMMIQMLQVKHGIKVEDDNQADACWIALWGDSQK